MKICTRCKIEYPLSSFAPRKDRGFRPHSWCDACRVKNVMAVHESRQRKIKIIQDIKRERGCIICGITEPVVLDFHHKDRNTKSFSLSDALRKHMSMEIMLQEIEKCIVLCANHHRMVENNILDIP